MSLADAPDAQARLAEFCDQLEAHDVPCSAFHFGSGYTSIGKRRYVFTWNRDKFPEPREAIGRFARAGVRTVVNLKPCLLDDHPAYADVAARGAFVNDARTGLPGIQRYAQTWSGDNTTNWHTLRWNLRMGLGMSLSGMFNTGHDVGGFFGPVPDPELLIRWTQSGAFSPRFIMNSWKAGGETNTPWLHPQALDAIRDAIRLRYRLM